VTPTTLHVLRVFVGPEGGGNPLGVFLDGAAVPPAERQAVAADLGFSETVFVDDPVAGTIHIHTPASELAFAGHPTVGTSWLLREEGHPAARLLVPAGEVAAWREGPLAWVRARAAWVHAMTLAELPDPAAVEALAGPPPGEGSWYAWSWIDRAAGVVRSRYFVPDLGIAEDEATGAAAVVVTDRLGRDLEIRQGRGSVLRTRRGPDGTVDLGGAVERVEERSYP
jgi:predicted PhzF superfamily epimerase YddE/YHI9